MAAAAKPILYSYWRSSASWRVRIALALKGIDYEYRSVHLVKKEHISEEYTSKNNPMGQVPTLVISDLVLTQSLPIIEYLDGKYPFEPRLLPSDLEGRAKVRMLSEVVNSGIQPIQNLSVLHYVGEKKMEFAHHFIEKGLTALEKMLAVHAGKYCYKDDVTMADCCLIPQFHNAKNRFGVDVSQFPVISRINEELSKHPAFEAAHPDSQPDVDDVKLF